MSLINKTLGQANPGSVLTNLYVTPGGSMTTASITVCNTGVFADTYRIAIAPSGAANDIKQYIAYDKVIAPNSFEVINNIYLKAGDVIRVYGSVEDVTFNAMGTENR